MKHIMRSVVGFALAIVVSAAPSAAVTYSWKIANPTNIVAYQVGKGVITIATDVVLCKTDELVPGAKPFDYTFKVGTPEGILCAWGALEPPPYTAPVAAYYEVGSPATVTVHTKAGVKKVTVTVPPPENPAIGHLPFH